MVEDVVATLLRRVSGVAINYGMGRPTHLTARCSLKRIYYRTTMRRVLDTAREWPLGPLPCYLSCIVSMSAVLIAEGRVESCKTV